MRNMDNTWSRTVSRARSSTVSVTLVAALLLALLPVGAGVAAASATELRTPVMNSDPVLTAPEVETWFLASRPADRYRATVDERTLVGLFADEGEREGVDWNIGLAQAILETGWFEFPDTGQVDFSDNNFGGMGAFDGQDGQNVFRFATAQMGVRAKMQHLRIYGDPTVNEDGTNLGSALAIDRDEKYPSRWEVVRNGSGPTGEPYRASATHWQDFGNGKWATDPFYSCKVLNVYRRMLAYHGHNTDGLPTNSQCLRTWHLKFQNGGGHPDAFAFLGREDDAFLACDFNGDGRDTPATFRDGQWTISNASNGSHPLTFRYGWAGDLPLCGDWDGSGKDTVGIVRDGRWHLKNSLSGGSSDIAFSYGRVTRGDIPIVGDWNGNGQDTAGIIRDREWHLRNTNSGGPGQIVFTYGRMTQGDLPLVGDWNGSGQDGVGIVREGYWHLRNRLYGGPGEIVFRYGRVLAGDVPLTGDWNADSRTTVAIVR